MGSFLRVKEFRSAGFEAIIAKHSSIFVFERVWKQRSPDLSPMYSVVGFDHSCLPR